MTSFKELWEKLIYRNHKRKKTQIVKAILRKINEEGDIMLPKVSIHYKVTKIITDGVGANTNMSLNGRKERIGEHTLWA